MDYRLEKLAFDLASSFRANYIKYSFKTFTMKNVKTSKWWDHFVKTAEKYIELENFNPSFFISIQFQTYGKVLPYFLHSVKAEKNYNNNFYEENNSTNSIIDSVYASRNLIEDWARKNKKETDDYFEFMNIFIFKRKIESLSPFYLCFSKSFFKEYAKLSYDSRHEVMPIKELKAKRSLAMQDLNTSKEIKKILDKDYI